MAMKKSIIAAALASSVIALLLQSCGTYYTVRTGNTLEDIAERTHTSVGELLALNQGISDPNHIVPGERIRLPRGARVGRSPVPSGPVPSWPVQFGSYHKLLQSYLGMPYGPSYPKGPDKKEEHVDCVSLIYKFAKDTGHRIQGARGDEIYHRCTRPITVITEQHADLSRLRTGDIIFIGCPWPQGEGGVSIFHLGIVDQPVYDKHGRVVDFTMVHASGGYGPDRARDYHGKVKEVRMLRYLAEFRDNPHRNHMYIGRLR